MIQLLTEGVWLCRIIAVICGVFAYLMYRKGYANAAAKSFLFFVILLVGSMYLSGIRDNLQAMLVQLP
ncbi:hypothetical protein GLW08_20325 [Pontibacillus yanchengensis]|uniref:Uncharacterized protein n=2 Tax=Pontibacillus yanchengensis TaxID=462910 RepID=A0ACC7VLI7_9BACI|nr:hypothetical protein [Pontibacillus yanchengensis]MYL35452.1 hypothetical protein [Pontibacillus yanchengensis]MYL55652.1 hypothetical protein [Pontibacillus yanchengensis]